MSNQSPFHLLPLVVVGKDDTVPMRHHIHHKVPRPLTVDVGSFVDEIVDGFAAIQNDHVCRAEFQGEDATVLFSPFFLPVTIRSWINTNVKGLIEAETNLRCKPALAI